LFVYKNTLITSLSLYFLKEAYVEECFYMHKVLKILFNLSTYIVVYTLLKIRAKPSKKPDQSGSVIVNNHPKRDYLRVDGILKVGRVYRPKLVENYRPTLVGQLNSKKKIAENWSFFSDQSWSVF